MDDLHAGLGQSEVVGGEAAVAVVGRGVAAQQARVGEIVRGDALLDLAGVTGLAGVDSR